MELAIIILVCFASGFFGAALGYVIGSVARDG